jgi:hypothetical protein
VTPRCLAPGGYASAAARENGRCRRCPLHVEGVSFRDEVERSRNTDSIQDHSPIPQGRLHAPLRHALAVQLLLVALHVHVNADVAGALVVIMPSTDGQGTQDADVVHTRHRSRLPSRRLRALSHPARIALIIKRH